MDPMIYLRNNFLRLMDDDEEEDAIIEEEEHLLLLAIQQRRRQEYRLRMHGFMDIIGRLNNDEFLKHFRINKTTFEYILRLILPRLSRQGAVGRNPILPKKQLLFSLWMMATPESYRSVCSRFHLGEATGLRSVRKVTNAIFEHRNRFIQWPTPAEAAVSMNEFSAARDFPRVIGVIDGMHIHILKPNRDADSYVNRKGYHSIVMQGVCDHRKKFIHVYVGEVGSVHDSRILRKSNLTRFYNNQSFPNDSHLLGDKGYGISKYILTPFKLRRALTQREKNYNFCLSSTRMVVERAFGLLKIKERRILDKLYMFRTDLIPRFIMALCIIHNINIEKNNLNNLPTGPRNYGNLPFGTRMKTQGERKRITIMGQLPLHLP